VRPENASAGRVVAHGVWSSREWKNNGVRDWAIVKLDRPLGRQFGYLEIDYESNVSQLENDPDFKLTIASFYSDIDQREQAAARAEGRPFVRRLWGQNECDFLGRNAADSSIRSHDCPNLPGTSGTPILHEGSDGELRVLGVNSTGRNYTHLDLDNLPHELQDTTENFLYNGALLIQDALPKARLEKIIRENPCQ